MASVGPHFAGSEAIWVVGDSTWANESNILSEDGNFATTTVVNVPHILTWWGFGFSIPAGTIDGFVFEYKGKVDVAGTQPLPACIVDKDTVAHTGRTGMPNNAPFLTTTNAWWSVGTSSNNVGSMTPADINTTNWGFDVSFGAFDTGTTYSIDAMRVTVYYTPGGASASIKVTRQAVMRAAMRR